METFTLKTFILLVGLMTISTPLMAAEDHTIQERSSSHEGGGSSFLQMYYFALLLQRLGLLPVPAPAPAPAPARLLPRPRPLLLGDAEAWRTSSPSPTCPH
ncbi:hypothetical protein MATL_G00222330 [Megalops atlanticus]|uniref:Uncharacterized protein n=1 Tax=Megalops atlanticus TaxID=7932 RepID=A0A9D3SYM1_MEGAT|nr:hypothetical protein MATL_G00222330 [Megalops atlanticus]